MKIFNQTIEILSQICEHENIDIKSELQRDLGFNSLQMVTLLVMLEETFEIVLDESDMNPFDLFTVEDVVCLVKKYRGDENEEQN